MLNHEGAGESMAARLDSPTDPCSDDLVRAQPAFAFHLESRLDFRASKMRICVVRFLLWNNKLTAWTIRLRTGIPSCRGLLLPLAALGCQKEDVIYDIPKPAKIPDVCHSRRSQRADAGCPHTS